MGVARVRGTAPSGRGNPGGASFGSGEPGSGSVWRRVLRGVSWWRGRRRCSRT